MCPLVVGANEAARLIAVVAPLDSVEQVDTQGTDGAFATLTMARAFALAPLSSSLLIAEPVKRC